MSAPAGFVRKAAPVRSMPHSSATRSITTINYHHVEAVYRFGLKPSTIATPIGFSFADKRNVRLSIARR